MSDDVDAELHPRDDDTDAQKEIFIDIRELVRTNMRDHKALRSLIDRLYVSGKKHRVGADGWDDDTKSLYARFGIPVAPDRQDKHESWYWRQFVRLHIAPLPKYYDDSTHPHLISTIARACWTMEFLCLIKRDTILTPSEGIMHELLGQGAVARFTRIPEAWRTQQEIMYDSAGKKVAKVPPPHLYPPPPDKAPVGTAEEGEAAGLAAVRKVSIDAADRNENPVPPRAPAITPDGRPRSEAFRTGFEQSVARNLKRLWDHRRGEIEGRDDTRVGAAEHVGDGKPPMAEEDIKPENFSRKGKSPSYNTGWLSVGPSEYTRVYARLKATAEEQARLREAESEMKRKQEEAARHKAEEDKRQADAAAAESERKRKREEDARRKADAAAAESERKRKQEEDARRKADAAAAESERKRKQEEDARRKAEDDKRKADAAVAEAERERREAVQQEAKRKAELEARKRDERHRGKIKADIIAAFVKANVPRNFAETAFTLMQSNAVPHIQIIY